jgi:hypothetical protein
MAFTLTQDKGVQQGETGRKIAFVAYLSMPDSAVVKLHYFGRSLLMH